MNDTERQWTEQSAESAAELTGLWQETLKKAEAFTEGIGIADLSRASATRQQAFEGFAIGILANLSVAVRAIGAAVTANSESVKTISATIDVRCPRGFKQ